MEGNLQIKIPEMEESSRKSIPMYGSRINTRDKLEGFREETVKSMRTDQLLSSDFKN